LRPSGQTQRADETDVNRQTWLQFSDEQAAPPEHNVTTLSVILWIHNATQNTRSELRKSRLK